MLNCQPRICPSVQLWISRPQSFGFVFLLTLTRAAPATTSPREVGCAFAPQREREINGKAPFVRINQPPVNFSDLFS